MSSNAQSIAVAAFVMIALVGTVLLLIGVRVLFSVASHKPPTRVDKDGDGRLVWHAWQYRRGIAACVAGVSLNLLAVALGAFVLGLG